MISVKLKLTGSSSKSLMTGFPIPGIVVSKNLKYAPIHFDPVENKSLTLSNIASPMVSQKGLTIRLRY
jgi:hypothetical protein